jgi:hypothetical protein
MNTHIDTYTKAILTIIAACLLWICLTSAGQPLKAQPLQYSPLPAQPVVVVGWGRLNPAAPGGIEIAWSDSARKISEAAVPIRPASDPKFEPVRVRVEMPAPLPVSLDAVRKPNAGAWDAVRTAAEPDAGSRVPGIRVPK